jgi:hypothetical protein
MWSIELCETLFYVKQFYVAQGVMWNIELCKSISYRQALTENNNEITTETF